MGISYSGVVTVVSGLIKTGGNNPPSWVTPAGSLGDATGGAPFNYNLSAPDADGESVSFSLIGSLPVGLTLNASGNISGTPVNTPGTYSFAVIATDGIDNVKRNFSINVINVTPSWVTAGGALTNAIGNVAYTTTVSATDANYDTVTYSLVSGTLPSGITLNGTTGELSGTPVNSPATYNFTLRANDGHGATADRSFSIAVSNTSPVWQSPTTTLPGPFTKDSAISTITLVATDANGDGITYALSASTLPAGLTLSGSQITGTPTVSGAFSFTVRASDTLGAYADRTFSMTIASPAATVSYTSSGYDTSAATYTFSGASIGSAAANRKLLIWAYRHSSGPDRTVSSLTVGGNNATYLTRYTSGTTYLRFIEAWIIDYPTGTTADIVINWNGSGQRGGFACYALYGASSTVYDSAEDGNPDTGDFTLAVDIPAGGVGIGGVCGQFGPMTWTGFTEDYDGSASNIITSGGSKASATLQTGFSVGISDSQTHAKVALVLSFAPL